MKTKLIAEHSKFWLGENVTKKLDTDSTLDLLKLSAYRRAISNFVYILTGKNIPVRFAEKSTSMTDGKVIYIGGELSKGEFDPTVGLSLHEAMHIVKSDFDMMKTMWGKLPRSLTAAANGKINSDELGKLSKYVLNVVEDRYIDAWAYETAPGYRGYYQALYDRYFNLREVSEGLKSDAYRTPTIKNYKFRFTNITNENTDLDALPALRKISDLLDLPNILRADLASFKDRMELAYQITELIVTSVINDKEDNKKNKDNEEGEGEDDSDGGSKADGMDPDDILGGETASANQITEESDKEQENPSKDLTEKQKDKIDKIIEKQESIVNRDVKQTPFDSETLKKLQILEKSDVNLVPVGDDSGVPAVECIFVKNMTKELMLSGEFPYTTKFGRDVENPQSKEGVKEGIVLGTMLGRKLQIRNESKTTKFTRLDAGKIDRRLLSSIGYQAENLFYQTSTDKYKNVHLHVTVDASSSMVDKWKRTMVTLVAIAKAASMINNVHVSISFRSGPNMDTNYRAAGQENPYIVMAYDSRKDKFSKIVQLFPLLFPAGSTPEGLAFQALLKHIPANTFEMDSYFLNLSDGEPAFGLGYFGEPAVQHTKKQVSKIRENGTTVLSYFIESAHAKNGRVDTNVRQFRTMYGKDAQFIDVANVTQIAHTLNKMFLSKES
jgi:hypothetical protein